MVSGDSDPTRRASFGADLHELVADCIQAFENGEDDPVLRICAHRSDLASAVQGQLDRLRGMGLLKGGNAPTSIGPYHLVREIGRGGMGSVFLARQERPIHRLVALKLIRSGLDSAEIVARFESERQALALMNHPSIAQVFDAGRADDGRPYFVMEYVPGTPMTTVADAEGLGVAARLQLFVAVCHAVQHAHEKGVIHRDLKPSNILVAEYGSGLVPKVIDFGISKATGPSATDTPYATQHGQMLGTPEYMSPEQASSGGVDVDVRTDIYSLGVVLYELLCGELPFESARLRRASPAELERILCEETPPPPSSRSSKLTPTRSGGVAPNATTRTTGTRRALRGDLDWIVLRALEKERHRRYPSALALADDIERHLAHKPVSAGPPTVLYRVSKLVRRHRIEFAATVIVSLALLSALAWAIERTRSELEAKAGLALSVRQFDQLSGVVWYERVVSKAQTLYPAWPDSISVMEDWLVDCENLLAKRAEIGTTLRDLRKQALPWSEEDQLADKEAHTSFSSWQQLSNRITALRNSEAVRIGTRQLVVPKLSATVRAYKSRTLNVIAWERVAPTSNERKVYGEETFGLACAQAAARKAKGGANHANTLDTLAWAWLANGKGREAVVAADAALAATRPDERRSFQRTRKAVERAIGEGAQLLPQIEQEFRDLSERICTRQTFRFPPEDESASFLYETMVELSRKLDTLASAQQMAVRQRHRWAQRIAELTRNHPNSKVSWEHARAGIANNQKYAGQGIDLRDADVLGLVPIGENPTTGLWEFYDLASAGDVSTNPATITIPQHEKDGSVVVTPRTGIVFVLVPGGTFWMGSQAENPNRPNFGSGARVDETVQEVTLSPFLIARHEVTRIQWKRLTHTRPFFFRDGRTYDQDPQAIGDTHPADTVSWEQADRWLRRHGMTLPTEAQWEYACRAGTTTPWWPGNRPSDLAGTSNVHDQRSNLRRSEWGQPTPIDDNYTGVAPVGTFDCNDWGLFDVHGNVWEWCRDWYGDYEFEARPGDGMRPGDPTANVRINRGGGYKSPAANARSAQRSKVSPSTRNDHLGLRAARPLTR